MRVHAHAHIVRGASLELLEAAEQAVAEVRSAPAPTAASTGKRRATSDSIASAAPSMQPVSQRNGG